MDNSLLAQILSDFSRLNCLFVSRTQTSSNCCDQIVIVTNEEERRELVSDIGEEALPEEYGGQAKLIHLQDVEIEPFE